MTLEGEFVRIAYNNEGYVSLGYRVANESLGQEWMLLQVGTTIRYGVQNFDLTRAAWSIETPDKKNIPMASNEEYRQVDLRGIELGRRPCLSRSTTSRRRRTRRAALDTSPPSTLA